MHAAFFIRVSRGSANAILRRYKVLLMLPVSFILVTFVTIATQPVRMIDAIIHVVKAAQRHFGRKIAPLEVFLNPVGPR